MVFLCTPAQTHNAPKSAFLLAVKGKKRSLSLSLSFSSVCVVVVVVRTHRAWCVLKAKKREKKKTIRKKFFYARAKRHKIYCKTVFDFSPLSLVLVLSGRRRRRRVPPPREREREVRASLQKRASSLVSRNILVCALSLFFFLL